MPETVRSMTRGLFPRIHTTAGIQASAPPCFSEVRRFLGQESACTFRPQWILPV